MVKGVKPSQGKSNQLARRVKVVAKAAIFAGLGNGQIWRIVKLAEAEGARLHLKTRVNSLKYAYARINSPAQEKILRIPIAGNAKPGALIPFLILVGTSRCDVPARVSEGGTNGKRRPLGNAWFPSPDAPLGDGDGAARHPYREQCQDASRQAGAFSPGLTLASLVVRNIGPFADGLTFT